MELGLSTKKNLMGILQEIDLKIRELSIYEEANEEEIQELNVKAQRIEDLLAAFSE
jgi:hypothetical protein